MCQYRRTIVFAERMDQGGIAMFVKEAGVDWSVLQTTLTSQSEEVADGGMLQDPTTAADWTKPIKHPFASKVATEKFVVDL